MSEVHGSLIEGLNEALALAQGKDTGAIVHQIDVPPVDVASVRASIGVAKGKLLNWEHGD
jgi:putative transcriptional regulator